MNLSADGDSPQVSWVGGVGTIAVYGSFGGGSLDFVFSTDQGVTWTSMGDPFPLTTAQGANFLICPCILKCTLSGSTSPDLDIDILNAQFT